MDSETQIVWMGSSKEDLADFPKAVVREMGFNLHLLQHGLVPSDAKPMKSLGVSVFELRVKDVTGIYRVIYVMTHRDCLGVLHCFKKKSQRTESRHVNTARLRLRAFRTYIEEQRK